MDNVRDAPQESEAWRDDVETMIGTVKAMVVEVAAKVDDSAAKDRHDSVAAKVDAVAASVVELTARIDTQFQALENALCGVPCTWEYKETSCQFDQRHPRAGGLACVINLVSKLTLGRAIFARQLSNQSRYGF